MGCMNATGYISGPIDPFQSANQSNFQTYLIEQLTLLGFQESEIVFQKIIEIKYIPYLRELQTAIRYETHSPYNQNVYLVPILPNQLRELYVKISEFLIRCYDYKLTTLMNQVRLKYQFLLRIGDSFPKILNLRLYQNQIMKMQIDQNLIIIVINQQDIGFQLLQKIKEINTKYLLIFKCQDTSLNQIQLFIQVNHLQNLSAIIGIDDREDRYTTIMNIYQKISKRQKKNSNSDSHSRMLTQFLNQEDQEQFWEDGSLIFNLLNSQQYNLEESSYIIKLKEYKIQEIELLFQNSNQSYNDQETISYQTVEHSIYKSLKQIIIKELIQALQLKSSSFTQYFKLSLTKEKTYKDLKFKEKSYKPAQIKIQNNNNIDQKAQDIINIIKKTSYNTLQILQSKKFQLSSKNIIKQLLIPMFQNINITIIYEHILQIQWSYGNDAQNCKYYNIKQLKPQEKYKWKIFNYSDQFKILNKSLPEKQEIYFIASEFKKCLQKQADNEIIDQLISNLFIDKWQIGENYYPICDVYQISFINSSAVDETIPQQEKFDKIIITQENIITIIFLMDYSDPQNLSQLDQIISLPIQQDYRLIILSNSTFDNDNFDELIYKKKIEKRMKSKNIQFWFPIQDQLNQLTFQKYLEIFYNLDKKENVLIINKYNQLIQRVSGFRFITLLQDKIIFDETKINISNKQMNHLIQSQSQYDQLKKLRQQLKVVIEKEIKQLQQLTLQNEEGTHFNQLLDFKWPKSIIIDIKDKQYSTFKKQYLKPIYLNTSGINLDNISQIIKIYEQY